MNVDEMSVVGWELNQCKPLVSHIPVIIDFLGYVPEDIFPGNTLSQKIKRYRLLHGMTVKQLARQLRVDEETLRSLEADNGRHFPETLKKLKGFLESLT